MADGAVNPKDGAELVFVPAGEFQFGLTDAQYRAFCKATGRLMPDSPAHIYEWPLKWTDRHPVTYVADCTGGALPSEEQSEKAARGIEGRLFPWGDNFDAMRLHGTIKRTRVNPRQLVRIGGLFRQRRRNGAKTG